jgi:hypothetical protein
MGNNANIGFHAARTNDANYAVSPQGNAAIGAYLYEIGIKDMNAIAYLTKAPPDAMTWMTPADANTYGIAVTIFSLDDARWSWAPRPSPPLPPSPIDTIGASAGKG